MNKLLTTLAIAPLFLAQPALAGHGTWYGHASYYEQHRLGADARQALQREAIERGIERGTISRFEAERLFEEQARIARIERIYKADGHFTPEERARIAWHLDVAARHIRQATNDRDRRYEY